MNRNRRRRVIAGYLLLIAAAILIVLNPDSYQQSTPPVIEPDSTSVVAPGNASQALDGLAVKGRAAKTGYDRREFGDVWLKNDGCDMRNIILLRDMDETLLDSECRVVKGTLDDPYTGETIEFVRGVSSSSSVQIDHVVALSDAWQKGAQQLTLSQRISFANDPLELLAVDGNANEQKSDGDAATWLPSYRPFRCQYIARQIAVKQKYHLWVTIAEKNAMRRVLSTCPKQSLPQQVN